MSRGNVIRKLETVDLLDNGSVEARLTEWVEWRHCLNDVKNLGYPDTDPIGRMMVEGPGAGGRSGAGVPNGPVPGMVDRLKNFLALTSRVRQVDDAITAMPSEYSAIIKMEYIEGKSRRAIASYIDISEQKVRHVRARALGWIQAVLEGAVYH